MDLASPAVSGTSVYANGLKYVGQSSQSVNTRFKEPKQFVIIKIIMMMLQH